MVDGFFVEDGHRVGGNDVSHFMNFCFQVVDVGVILLNCVVSFIVFLDQSLLLRCHSFKLIRKGFSSSLQLLSLLDKFFKLECVFKKLIFCDIFLSF